MISRDYPYMYARISAKKAKLLDSEDYERLVKMGPNEIARNLEEGAYQKDIDELGSDYEGVQLLELALMRNLSRTMSDLIDISPDSLDPMINAFLRRYDILSIKRLLRWKRGNEKGSVRDLLVPVGDYSVEELEELSEEPIEEIIQSIEFPESNIDYQSYIEDKDDIKKVERDLDRAYFDEIKQISDKSDSMWFKRFIKKEMEYEDLKTVLRLKKYGRSEEEIREWLITDKPGKCVKNAMKAGSLENAVREVEECEDLYFEDRENVEEIEHTLEVERLKAALRTLHTEPLGLTSIFGYIVAKMIEVKNLRMLIRAKETEIQNLETIRNNLVTA